MYSLPILEREVAMVEPAYGNTVHFEISDLVLRGVATTDEIKSWAVAGARFAWMEGASDPVVRSVYRGRLRQLVKHNGRYFTQLFVNRDLMLSSVRLDR
jgi:hypothetical protein